MATADGEITRTVVQTYIPEYQRDEWDAHAERLDMNRSEFIRTMVQAGRRGFDEYVTDEEGDTEEDLPSEDSPAQPPMGEHSSPTDPDMPDNQLEDVVIEELRRSEYLSWDDLLTEITDDIEARLDETLQQLQSENRINYSGRHDGYVLNDGEPT